jgi:4-hydroxythreonine-4-phosphate dehydrogenase
MTLALSIGCPAGIGPEVALRAAAGTKRDVLLVGDHALLVARAKALRLPVLVQRIEPGQRVPRGSLGVYQPTANLRAPDRKAGAPTEAGGAAQLAWINAATDLVLGKTCAAIVTGPVSKETIVSAGHRDFVGHTEHLMHRTGAREVIMAFYHPTFTTSLVTTHLGIRKVPKSITVPRVAAATALLAAFLFRVGVTRPRVAVCGLNPHAGEHGLFGDEESRLIAPGMLEARRRPERIDGHTRLFGPVPAEAAFRKARDGAYDGVVAMYHDQATIPMKLIGFGEAVNVSLGLPIVRTSVDHGTAYDIAGRGLADARGMRAALQLARVLTRAEA